MPTQHRIFLDNTRISSYRKCPREHLLRHQLFWTVDQASPPLDFGGAFHAGMTEFLRHKDEGAKIVADAAFAAFEAEWFERGRTLTPEDLADLHPRVPAVAAQMYFNMAQQYEPWLRRIEVLEIEQPFCVPLFAKGTCPYCLVQEDHRYWLSDGVKECPFCGAPLTEVYLVGRRDCVYREGNEIWALEHKTSSLYSKDHGFQYNFINGFNIDSQVDGYYYTTRMTHGERATGVMINGCLVYRTRQDVFKLLPQRRTTEQALAWFNETAQWVSQLLRKQQEGPEAFPRNPSACKTPYGMCSFHDVCRFHLEPWKEEYPPIGYKVERWEPFDEAELLKLLEGVQNG